MITRRGALAAAGVAAWPAMVFAQPAAALPVLAIAPTDDPRLTAWAAQVASAYPGWWTGMAAALASPEFHPPATVRLNFTPDKDAPPGATGGATITVNAPYVLSGRGSPNLVCHELAHVVQQYPDGTEPGWLTEGIADWVRYDLLIPDDPERRFDPARVDYRRGYQPAAALLAWCEARKPGTVRAVNAAMRRGRDGAAALTSAMGAEPDALWRAYLADPNSARDWRMR